MVNEASGIAYGGRLALRKRIDNALLIGMPLVGSIYAAHYFASHALHRVAIAQAIVWTVVIGISIGLGFHRHFSHRAFKADPIFRFFLGLTGTFALQGSVTRWVADHRRHHRFTDTERDTHTPMIEGSGKATLAGLGRAHLGWMFDHSSTDERRFAPDLVADPLCQWLTRWHWPLVGLSLGLPALFGYAIAGREAAFQSFLLAGCARVTLIHQTTWMVNSLGHAWGSRDATTSDYSRNNTFIALLTFGEGWHNNHHAKPTCADLNFTGKQFDFNAKLLRGLERLGWVHAVRWLPRATSDF
jgi:stearoyl-CoA desaturase (Delta-9 desaturase)